MNTLCEKHLCTGCGACYNKCPQNAISMKENDEGFLYPEIDAEKCTNCGLCQKICPINNFENNNEVFSDKYLVMASNEIRRVSTSGGVFRVLADYVLKNNGYVCGAVFNENMVVEHILSNKFEDVLRMSDSKYVQSNLKNCYKEIKEKLEQNIQVLFSGCPCQVAGLISYLQKDYSNLITVDLICHGAPSPLVLKKYLEEEFSNEKVLDMKFRNKKNGWGHNNFVIVVTDKNTYEEKWTNNPYTEAFGKDIANRKSCYNCRFTTQKRTGDFTMCDAWGYEKKFNDQKGSSIIFVNNEKAKNVFKNIKNDFIRIKKIKSDYTQPQMEFPASENPARKTFFEDIKNKSLREALKNSDDHSKNVAILNYGFSNQNFGAVLTAYALTKSCNDLGYNAQNINYRLLFSSYEPYQKNKNFDEFKEKYLPTTKLIRSENDFEALNNTFDNFIVGSDQVFGYHFIEKDSFNHYFLGFAKPDKKLIACSASFGIQKAEDIKASVGEHNELYSLYLKNFNSISIREEEGVKYCASLGINDATWLIDPVFFVSKNEWIKLLSEPVKNERKKHNICSYAIEKELVENIINKLKSANIINEENSYIDLNSNNSSIQDWLWQIYNSDFVITRSFHGTCFAIILNKPFIIITSGKDDRLNSLLNSLNLENRIYNLNEEFDFEQLKESINYDVVNEKLEEYRKFGLNWLKTALGKPVNNVAEKIKTKNEINEILLLDAKKNIRKAFKNYLLYRLKYFLTSRKDKKERYKRKDSLYTAKYKIYKKIIKDKV